MLYTMTPDQFRERYAHYLVEPWGDEWRQTGSIVAEIANQVTRYMYAKAGRKPEGMLTADEVIPKLRFSQNAKHALSDDETFEELCKLI